MACSCGSRILWPSWSLVSDNPILNAVAVRDSLCIPFWSPSRILDAITQSGRRYFDAPCSWQELALVGGRQEKGSGRECGISSAEVQVRAWTACSCRSVTYVRRISHAAISGACLMYVLFLFSRNGKQRGYRRECMMSPTERTSRNL